MKKQNENNQPKNELTISERFTMSVQTSYSDIAKGFTFTDKEKSLVAGYFVALDNQFKNGDFAIPWSKVKMNDLGLSLARMAKLGLNMQADNTLSYIPFKDGKSQQGMYNLIPCIGWKGYAHIARKFSVNPIHDIVVELVYSTDRFVITKKDANHPCDGYEFEVTNPFNRGEVIGAFCYIIFEDETLNRLTVMPLDEILSYKPARASDQFWGNKRNKLNMYKKTVAKKALKAVELDEDKVNPYKDDFDSIAASEIEYADYSARNEIDENVGKGDYVDIDGDVIEMEDIEPPTEEVRNNHVRLDEMDCIFDAE